MTLLVDEAEAGSRQLTVMKDPNSEGTLAEIEQQYALVREWRMKVYV